MTRRRTIGAVRPDLKEQRRKLVRERFKAENPEPMTVEEWETFHPLKKGRSQEQWESKRQEIEEAREAWEAHRYDEAHPYFRTPRGSAQQRLQWLEEQRKKGALPGKTRLDKYKAYERQALHRHRSMRAQGSHAEEYCSSVCQRYADKERELALLEENLTYELLPWGIVTRQIKKVEKQRAHAAALRDKCERTCYDRELGRGYRKARGWEFTGRRAPLEHLTAAEQAKYAQMLREREGVSPEQKRRRMWEEGMMQWSDPALLPHGGYTPKQRKNAALKWAKKKCKGLKGAEHTECLRKLTRATS